jgi:outer membrane immunogenic protein
MLRLTLGLIALVAAAFAIASADAADIPVKAAPAPAAVGYSWSGFYVGGNVGYGWGRNRTATFAPNDLAAFGGTCGGFAGGECAGPAAFRPDGGLGGLQAGYNWQINRSWLLGVEADFQWSGIDGAGTSPPFRLGTVLAGPDSTFRVSEDIKNFATVRLRAGWLPTDNLLAYATGGVAFGRASRTAVLDSVAGTNLSTGGFSYRCIAGPACFTGSSTRTSIGWSAGAGIEYAAWRNWRVKAEYLYVDLGSEPVRAIAAAATVFGPIPASFTVNYGDTVFHVVRLGINYKFGGPTRD